MLSDESPAEPLVQVRPLDGGSRGSTRGAAAWRRVVPWTDDPGSGVVAAGEWQPFADRDRVLDQRLPGWPGSPDGRAQAAGLAEDGWLADDGWPRRPFVTEAPAWCGRSGEEWVDEVLQLIAAGCVRHPQVRLVRGGAGVDPAEFTLDGRSLPSLVAGRVDATVAGRTVAGGGTLVVTGVEDVLPEVRAECAVLGTAFGCTAGATLFCSGPRAPGFPAHYDSSHSLLVQLRGAKTWRCHRPVVPHPMDHHPWPAVSGYYGRDDLLSGREADVEVELTAGHALWIPTGWIHEGVASAASSVHLTFGVRPMPVLQLVECVLADADAVPELRRTLPSRPASAGELRATASAALRRLADLVDREELRVGPALQEVLLFGRAHPPVPPPPTTCAPAAGAPATVCLRAELVHGWRTVGERSELHLGDRVLTVGGWAATALAGWRDGAPVDLAPLRHRWGRQVDDLVTTLAAQGVLTVLAWA